MTRDTNWPTEITPAILAKNAHVSDAQIAKDIEDTVAEIVQYEKLIASYRVVAAEHPDQAQRQLAQFRVDAYPAEIAVRERFTKFLIALRDARASAGVVVT